MAVVLNTHFAGRLRGRVQQLQGLASLLDVKQHLLEGAAVRAADQDSKKWNDSNISPTGLISRGIFILGAVVFC